jgi:hypothetical protein
LIEKINQFKTIPDWRIIDIAVASKACNVVFSVTQNVKSSATSSFSTNYKMKMNCSLTGIKRFLQQIKSASIDLLPAVLRISNLPSLNKLIQNLLTQFIAKNIARPRTKRRPELPISRTSSFSPPLPRHSLLSVPRHGALMVESQWALVN